MELSSYSPPLSVNSSLNTGGIRRFSFPDAHRRCRRVVARSPSLVSSCSYGCSTSGSSSSSFLGASIAKNCDVRRSVAVKKSGRSFFVVSGIFERFTERAIKAVMLSQREAKALGSDSVSTQHLLLGLVSEDRAPDGFLGSGITIDVAREVVRSLWPEDHRSSGNVEALPVDTSATDMAFSTSTKRVFEAAVEYSKTMGYNYIAPEHIAIGLFTVDDGSASRVLMRYEFSTIC